MYELFSPMWNEVVSRHKSFEAALKAAKKFQRGGTKDTFKPWKIRDAEGNVISKYGMFEATGYHA